jgi:hypothetical protein
MAEPKTILEYATSRSDSAAQALTAANQQLAAAQSNLALANSARAAASAELAGMERQAADLRQKLSKVATQADGAKLLDELEQTTIRIRAQQAAIVKLQEKFSLSQAGMTKAQADVAAATKEQSAATTALQAAINADALHQAWVEALTNPPLSTINNDAGKTLDPANVVEGAAFKKAKDRIEADIPARLLQRAEERRTQAAKVIDQENRNAKLAEDAILKEHETNGSLADKAAKKLVDFKRAETAVNDFISGARSSFDEAKKSFAEVGDPDKSSLTPEQKSRVHDPALLQDREDAATEESKLHTDKLQPVLDKQVELDAAILKAKADPTDANLQDVQDVQGELTDAQQKFAEADTTWREAETKLADARDDVEEKEAALAEAIKTAVANGVDPDTDMDVGKAKNDLDKANEEVKLAEDAYKASQHGIVDLWEAAVPDSTWRLLEKYEHAGEILNALKLSNPDTLKQNLITAEEEYVKAQLAADKSNGILTQLTSEQISRVARNEGAQQTSGARLFGALRGDE